MARLNAGPRRKGVPTISPPPPSSHASSDAEETAQQLVAEARASASRTPKPPQSSAVLGANLLNAARIEFRHSSPVRMARTAGNGKLSRPSFVAEPPRKNPARTRDIYQLTESPEKKTFELPETATQAPLKVLRKNKVQEEDSSWGQRGASALPVSDGSDVVVEKDVPEQAGSVHDEELVIGDQHPESADEPHLPSSPPDIALGSDDKGHSVRPSPPEIAPGDVVIEAHLPSGVARCTVVCYRSDKPKGPRYEQCHLLATKATSQGLRCGRHMQKPASLRCGYVSSLDKDSVQCPVAGVKGTTRCAKHAAMEKRKKSLHQHSQQNEREVSGPDRGRLTAQSRARRKSEDHQDDDGRQSKSSKSEGHAIAGRNATKHTATNTTNAGRARGSATKSRSKAHIPFRQSRNDMSAQEGAIAQGLHQHPQEHVADTIEVVAPAPPTTGRSTRSKAQPSHGSKLASSQVKSMNQQSARSAPSLSKQAQRKDVNDPEVSEAENVQDGGDSDTAEGEEDLSTRKKEAHAEEASGQSTHPPGTLHCVFGFLSLGERSGRCQTELGANIKRVCDKTTALFHKEDFSMEDITDNTDEVRAVLQKIREVDEHDRPAFKGDAYGYIFRSLTLCLQSLHKWLAEKEDDVTWSLEALRVLSPLVREIIAFKDTISTWNMSVSHRYKGDKIIMDVNSHLIAPLREVAKSFSKRLSWLEGQEQNRQKLQDIYRQVEEEEVETQRREEAIAVRKERWKRWQELHIKRMQCEPDPFRRRKLHIVKLEDLEEEDANGIKFERLPLFKNRVVPPLRPYMSEKTEWTQEQETVLLEDLQNFAGPRVFHDIFEASCRPGGALRDFSVTDITAKAAWVRSAWVKLQQQEGWEMPAWVEQIPVLP